MQRLLIVTSALAAVFSVLSSSSAQAQWGGWNFGTRARQSATIVVNGRRLSPAMQWQLAARGVRVPPGRYWYDRRSGMWGVEGGPVRGILPAGLRIGGRLRANASNGRTSYYINGRRLTRIEVMRLGALLGRRVAPGKYWVDARGNAGRVGGPALVNLRSLVRRSRAGRSWRYHKGNTHMLGNNQIQGIRFKVAGKTYSYITP